MVCSMCSSTPAGDYSMKFRASCNHNHNKLGYNHNHNKLGKGDRKCSTTHLLICYECEWIQHNTNGSNHTPKLVDLRHESFTYSLICKRWKSLHTITVCVVKLGPTSDEFFLKLHNIHFLLKSMILKVCPSVCFFVFPSH